MAMDLSELDFEHPAESVAKYPAARREDARLLLLPSRDPLAHARVTELPQHFEAGDVLVLNDTWVQPARLFGQKESGGRVEIVILERRSTEWGLRWVGLVGSARAPRPGARLLLAGGACTLKVTARDAELFVMEAEGDLESAMAAEGSPPLPPYLGREAEREDVLRYQTTYARPGGWGGARSSAAAPTAGLHLTPELLAGIEARGTMVVRLQLGVGAGTFLPVQAQRVEEHRMHEEDFAIPEETASVVNAALAEGRRVTAVGTTTLRALEASTTPSGAVRPLIARTGLFLVPGSPFRVVSRLMTNFHQPRTTLLALVHAFAGADRMRKAQAAAIAAGYRLFSYGDAMLIERAR